jgi:hypothetical protein
VVSGFQFAAACEPAPAPARFFQKNGNPLFHGHARSDSLKVWPVSEGTETKAASFTDNRPAREWKTLQAMIQIYCQARHGANLCPECRQLRH